MYVFAIKKDSRNELARDTDGTHLKHIYPANKQITISTALLHVFFMATGETNVTDQKFENHPSHVYIFNVHYIYDMKIKYSFLLTFLDSIRGEIRQRPIGLMNY